MRELTCIVCPLGCSLLAEEEPGPEPGPEKLPKENLPTENIPTENLPALTITGNLCKRGISYAQEEIRSPKRMVTATCGIANLPDHASLTARRRVPVKTSAACPKGRINELLEDIYTLALNLPVKTGDRAITNWKNTGIDVIVTRSLG